MDPTSEATSKLEDAQKAIDAGRIRVAKNELLDFIDQVEGQRGKSLTDSQANLLVAHADNMLSLL